MNKYITKPEEILNDNLLIEQLEPEFNEDETNDFDLKPEKKPALSTMKSNLKRLNKMSDADEITNSMIVQQFDKLKMWIDLNKHDLDIGFLFNNIKESNMMDSDDPEKPDTYFAENKRFDERLDNIINKCKQPQINYELEAELNEYQERNIIDITNDEIQENKIFSKRKNKYPNCKVIYSCRKVGLLNVYIKNDRLYLIGNTNRLIILTLIIYMKLLKKCVVYADFILIPINL